MPTPSEQALLRQHAKDLHESRKRHSPRALRERGLQVADHEAVLGPIDSRAAYPDAPRDRLVTGAGIRSRQNLRALELGVACRPPLRRPLKFIAFGFA
jgi:hypothetical protein